MDQELRAMLHDIAEIEYSGKHWDFNRIEKLFQDKYPDWRIAYFHDRHVRDDNVLLHLWTGDKDHWVHIYTNDDPFYSPMTIDRDNGLYDHDLGL